MNDGPGETHYDKTGQTQVPSEEDYEKISPSDVAMVTDGAWRIGQDDKGTPYVFLDIRATRIGSGKEEASLFALLPEDVITLVSEAHAMGGPDFTRAVIAQNLDYDPDELQALFEQARTVLDTHMPKAN